MSRTVVSVVSHGQGALVRELLADMAAQGTTDIRLVLTVNVPEELPFRCDEYTFPIEIIHNDRPKGFAANQNQAFHRYASDYFCVVNPDIRVNEDPFVPLVRCLEETGAAVAAPVVTNPDGTVQPSVRPFPTPWRIVQKAFGFCGASTYPPDAIPATPDWAAGMFLVLRSSVFRRIGGFDERFYLYYEDVDLCARLRLAGAHLLVCSGVTVTHAAQRASHRHLGYCVMHMASMTRFFCSSVFRRLWWSGLLERANTSARRAPVHGLSGTR